MKVGSLALARSAWSLRQTLVITALTYLSHEPSVLAFRPLRLLGASRHLRTLRYSLDHLKFGRSTSQFLLPAFTSPPVNSDLITTTLILTRQADLAGLGECLQLEIAFSHPGALQ